MRVLISGMGGELGVRLANLVAASPGVEAVCGLDLDPQRIRIRITQLRLSNGTIVKPDRDISLSVPPGAVLRRNVDGFPEPLLLTDFRAGDRVIAWANEFPETLASARGLPGVHTIRDILQLRQ